MKPVLIDTATAAVELGTSPRTVRRLVADGLLTNYGDARHIRVRLGEVMRLELHVVGAQPRRVLRRLNSL